VKIQITTTARSSALFPMHVVAPTSFGFKGRAVPASWLPSVTASSVERHGGTALDATAIDGMSTV